MFFSTKALALLVASLAIASQASPVPEEAATNAEAQIGPTHTGDATFYTPGLGACGRNNNANELVAAAAVGVFDNFPGHTANPNKNPICGKKAKVSFGGKSVTVTIVDRCPGCGASGIDLSPAAFQKLAPLSKGRLRGAKWTVQ
ncbi:hypothetical protein E1B28_008235 [Marasmius oreades]|uniref:RlpA-like protein double-psi beta-barrel domain-containing protein n=1 Tax=Marasmius oreades TaxID=181124 RepID=A0A9P7UT38_9AGAR|nr:uncharacterized protein E1B28_008235 [Marasmius oreades]KAG7091831.1 hypothetical protein E1B28_008235 [Marasmius oreades]